MAEYRAPLEDIRFVLQHQLNAEALWQRLPGFDDMDVATAGAVLEEVARLVQNQLAPLNRSADETGCSYKDGRVTTPVGFREAYQLFHEGGWGALSGNPEWGGMGMPKSLVSAVDEIVQGGCMAFGLAPMLTAGACLAIDAHGSEALKSVYLPKMYAGEWAGAMDLTEPHAGTDLGLMRTRAEPTADGCYCITGTKIFITWGEHDMADNIVHLVLAKLPDAPAGSRGISLFLVPKYLPDADGNPGERNALHCGSIEKKMGIKASATCVMNFDGATGWLLGEPHKGLTGMFTMMNYERLVVGIQGLGVAEASYQTAVAYARERLQGRSLRGTKWPNKPADPLLVHGDIRRQLMLMRVFNEGGRAFYLYVAQWLDIAKFSPITDEHTRAQKLVALLTPIAKAFLTDRALETALMGQQILGGHGYIREWKQEQHVRDIRITQLYEGTNGIQAMDLVVRKTQATKGQLLQLFLAEIQQYLAALDASQHTLLPALVRGMEQTMVTASTTTQRLLGQADKNPDALGVAAVDYLDMLGYLSLAYMWLRAVGNGAESACYNSKVSAAEFYFARVLPEVDLLAARIATGPDCVMNVHDDDF